MKPEEHSQGAFQFEVNIRLQLEGVLEQYSYRFLQISNYNDINQHCFQLQGSLVHLFSDKMGSDVYTWTVDLREVAEFILTRLNMLANRNFRNVTGKYHTFSLVFIHYSLCRFQLTLFPKVNNKVNVKLYHCFFLKLQSKVKKSL